MNRNTKTLQEHSPITPFWAAPPIVEEMQRLHGTQHDGTLTEILCSHVAEPENAWREEFTAFIWNPTERASPVWFHQWTGRSNPNWQAGGWVVEYDDRCDSVAEAANPNRRFSRELSRRIWEELLEKGAKRLPSDYLKTKRA